MGAVAEDDVQQFLNRYFPAVMGRHYPVQGGSVLVFQESGNAADNAPAVIGDFRRLIHPGQPFPARPHIRRGHAAGAVAEPSQFRERQDVDNGIPQGFRPPSHFPLQLRRGKLEGSPDSSVQDAVVLVRHPLGPPGKLHLRRQLQEVNQLPGVVADDDFGIVHHRDRRRLDAVTTQESLGFRLAGNVVVLILNTVGG